VNGFRLLDMNNIMNEDIPSHEQLML